MLIRLCDFFGLERNILVLTGAGLIQSFGVALWDGYLPKMLEVLGARGVMIGAFGTIGAFLWIAFPYLGGTMSDRVGRGRAMILASALAAIGYLIYMLAPVWWLFLPGLVLTTASGSFGFMSSLALTGDVLQSQRRAVSIAVRGVVGVLPNVLAPPIGGALIMWLGVISGIRASLLITIALTLIAIWLQHRYYRIPHIPSKENAQGVRAAWRAMRPELKRLLTSDCLVRIGSGMTNMFIVLYVLNVVRSTALEFGLLKSLETITSAALLIPLAKLADRAGRASRYPFIAATFYSSQRSLWYWHLHHLQSG